MKIKPKVFVSSTIAEFHDLRTAIKFYLEELGYEALLSECNDFPKPLDTDTFNACLNVIEQCDYYILLIGAEVGSLWDAEKGISITRMEYRKAQPLLASGDIRMLLFARQNIWEASNTWKKVRSSFSAGTEVPTSEDAAISKLTIPGICNPRLVFSFLEEVADEESSSRSTNWIHSFSSFRDVVDALRAHLGIADDLQHIALGVNLRREVLANLALLLQKGATGILPSYEYGIRAFRSFSGGLEDRTLLPSSHVRWAVMYAMSGGRDVEYLRTQVLNLALETDYGLSFDTELSTLKHTRLSERLHQLRESIARLRMLRLNNQERLIGFASDYLEPSKQETDIAIPNDELLCVATLAGEEENCVQLLRSIVLALDGQEGALESVALNPPSPIKDEQPQIAWENVSLEEARNWVSETTSQDTAAEM